MEPIVAGYAVTRWKIVGAFALADICRLVPFAGPRNIPERGARRFFCRDRVVLAYIGTDAKPRTDFSDDDHCGRLVIKSL
jgi:hypothetical protein